MTARIFRFVLYIEQILTSSISHFILALNQGSGKKPSLNGKDVREAGNLEDLIHIVFDMDQLHTALLGHDLLRREQDTESGR
jgi:hypothetical protein